MTTLTCIADEENYLVKDPKIKQMIFGLVKEKLIDTSVVLTPVMMRYLSSRIINSNQSFFIQVENFIFIAESRLRLFIRTGESILIGALGGLIESIQYITIAIVMFYSATENCGHQFNNYFEQLLKRGLL